MKQAIFLIFLTVLALEAGFLLLGYVPVANIVYGAIALMAVMIAATFLWLWFERTTPLAIGMVVSWFGMACLAGWWWVYNLTGSPDWASFRIRLFSFDMLHPRRLMHHREAWWRARPAETTPDG